MAISEEKLKYISLRNAKIVVLWGRHHWSKERIAERFKISVRRIDQIVYKHHEFLNFNTEYEKKRRIIRLQNWLHKNKDSKKDPLEVQEQLRKELEGDNPTPTAETKIVIIREGKNENQDQGRTVPGSISIVRV